MHIASLKHGLTQKNIDILTTRHQVKAMETELCSVCNDLHRCDSYHEHPIDFETALRPLWTVRASEQ
jgi:hypothetical protein